MKKILTGLTLALVAILMFSSVALAWCGSDADADVNCGDVTVNDSDLIEGDTVTFSGSIDIEADAYTYGLLCWGEAESEAGYSITNPLGYSVGDSNYEEDSDYGIFSASVNADQTFNWSYQTELTTGYWTVDQYGLANAYVNCLLGRDKSDCDSDSNSTMFRVYSKSHSPDNFKIFLPNKVSKSYFYCGAAVPEDITFTDGTWEVFLPAGMWMKLPKTWDNAHYLKIGDGGKIISDIKFINGEPRITEL